MSYENVDVFVQSTDVPPSPVQDVVVKVLSADGTMTFSQGQSDADGKASFLLPSGMTYQLRFYKFATSFKQPQLITVNPTVINQPPPNNRFNVYAEIFKYPQATDPRLCQASGFFRTPSGAIARYVDMHFIAKFDPILLEQSPILVERVSTRSDDKGYASVSLIRCAIYDVTLQGMENVYRSCPVPDVPWVNLGDLLFPRVSTVVFDPAIPQQELALTVGEEVTFDVKAATTARYYLQDITSDLNWIVDDFTIASFTPTPTTLKIKGISPGVTYIRAERKDTSIIAIPNTPVAGVPIKVTVA